LQSDGVKHKTYGASTIIINGQVGILKAMVQSLVLVVLRCLRIRKQLVEKFDGSICNRGEKHTPLVQDQLILLILQMRRKVICI
jgi:hypothetical protein